MLALPSPFVTVALPTRLPAAVLVPPGRGVFVVPDAGVPGFVCIVVVAADGKLKDVAFIAEPAYHTDTLQAFRDWLELIDPVARPALRAVS